MQLKLSSAPTYVRYHCDDCGGETVVEGWWANVRFMLVGRCRCHGGVTPYKKEGR
jgi:hypothetical protein